MQKRAFKWWILLSLFKWGKLPYGAVTEVTHFSQASTKTETRDTQQVRKSDPWPQESHHDPVQKTTETLSKKKIFSHVNKNNSVLLNNKIVTYPDLSRRCTHTGLFIQNPTSGFSLLTTIALTANHSQAWHAQSLKWAGLRCFDTPISPDARLPEWHEFGILSE